MMDSCEIHGWWEVDGQDTCPVHEIARLQTEHDKYLGDLGEALSEGNKLRAEVERLKDQVQEMEREGEASLDRIMELRRERDKAFSKVTRLKQENLAEAITDIVTLRRERDEARAQVAVFLSALDRCEGNRGAFSCNEPHDIRCPKSRAASPDECVCGREELDRAVANSPTEARALLDRLNVLEEEYRTSISQIKGLLDRIQRLEDDNVRLRWELDAMKPSELDASVLDRLQRAEAVVEAVRAIDLVGLRAISGAPRNVHEALLNALAAWEKNHG